MQKIVTPCFQVGGTLKEGALYITRQADSDLPAALVRGEYCYVLAPRQIGKSSLRVRTKKKLEEQGARCVAIDLTQIGGRDASASEWYFDLVHQMARQLKLGDQSTFWEEHHKLSPLARWTCFLHDEVLQRVPHAIVVFIDEIDAVVSLSAGTRDDFLASVRALYNARADDPAYERLTFCLFGVAMPGDLIQDEARTPFNIGRAISLEDFTQDQMAAMLPCLKVTDGDPTKLLDEVFYWTHGHPYMTQMVCESLLEPSADQTTEAEWVKGCVGQLFMRRGRVLETNLASAEKHFGRGVNSSRTAQMLRLYGRLRAGEKISAQGQDPIQMALRLSGMAAERRDESGVWLEVRNPIFATVFDEAWVREKAAERLLADPLRTWLESGRDRAYALRGHQLKQACDWAQGNDTLTASEHEFLLASLHVARIEEKRRVAFSLLLVISIILVASLASTYRDYRIAQNRARREETLQLAARRKAFEATAAAADAKREAERAKVAEENAKREAKNARRAEARVRDEAERARVAETSALHEAKRARLAEMQERNTRQEAQANEVLANLAKESANREKQRAEELALNEKSLRSAVLARHPGQQMSAIVLGAQFLLSKLKRHETPSLEDLEGLVIAAATLIPSRTLVGHTGPVRSAAYSPDGRQAVTASDDQTARIWDVQSGRLLMTLVGHTGPVRSAAYSPDGSRIVTASDDGTARVWDVRRGRLVLPLEEEPSAPVRTAAFSSDGKRIVTGDVNGNLRIWGARSGSVILTIFQTAPIWSASFSPDGDQVITAGDEEVARLWSAKTGMAKMTLRGHSAPIRSIKFSPDGKWIITASEDRTARLWDAHSGVVLGTLTGHSAALSSASFSPITQQVLTTSDDRTVRTWALHAPRTLLTLQGHTDHVQSATFSSDGKRVVTASDDRTVRVWDAWTSRPLLTLRVPTPAWSAAFSPDGSRIASAGMEMIARVWDSGSGRLLLSLGGHDAWVRSVAYSPDGARILTASYDKTARLWDARDGRLLLVLKGHQAVLFSAAFSQDGLRIVTASYDGTARLWDAQTGRLMSVMPHVAPVRSANFSPDGARIVTGSDDEIARVWDARSGSFLFDLVGQKGWIRSAVYSPNGKWIMTAGDDWAVRIWDSRGGHHLLTLEGPGALVESAAFSSDGKWIVTAGANHTAVVLPAFAQGYVPIVCSLLQEHRSIGDIDKTEMEELVDLCGLP